MSATGLSIPILWMLPRVRGTLRWCFLSQGSNQDEQVGRIHHPSDDHVFDSERVLQLRLRPTLLMVARPCHSGSGPHHPEGSTILTFAVTAEPSDRIRSIDGRRGTATALTQRSVSFTIETEPSAIQFHASGVL